MTSVRDFSNELQVPVAAVVKALMRLGTMKHVHQELTESELEILRNDPDLKTWKPTPRRPPPRPEDGPDPAGVREPRRPRPQGPPSADALPSPEKE
jgi:Translation initiation factor IF-2, N-terminal region